MGKVTGQMLADVERADFWRALAPYLGIERQDSRSAVALDVDPATVTAQRRQFIEDGYFVLPRLFADDIVAPLRAAVSGIVDAGLPAAFVFAFDEAWLLLARARRAVAGVFGEDVVVIGNFWAWLVPNEPGARGFRAHRDYYERCLLPDGMPAAANLWVALSDAEPPGSCLYFLPASHDPNYPDMLRNTQVDDLQAVRAAPAPAGTVIGVGSNVLHWGGHGSDLAEHPRISLALQVQSRRFRPLDNAAWPADMMPDFDERLALIGKQILLYQHHGDFDPDIVALGRRLSDTAAGGAFAMR